jgi:hypothetical protein
LTPESNSYVGLSAAGDEGVCKVFEKLKEEIGMIRRFCIFSSKSHFFPALFDHDLSPL